MSRAATLYVLVLLTLSSLRSPTALPSGERYCDYATVETFLKPGDYVGAKQTYKVSMDRYVEFTDTWVFNPMMNKLTPISEYGHNGTQDYITCEETLPNGYCIEYTFFLLD